MSFDSLGLRPELLSAIASQGYATPTPIQTEAIPVIFEGCDLLAGAQTGTGKTAAFALPIVQRLGENIPPDKRRRPRALVLVPTRELAAQVSEQMNNYARRLSLRSTMIYGGVTIQAQIERLHRGVDIVVRKHQLRSTDFRAGKRLGKEDHLVVWSRPQRPPWMSVEQYLALPASLTLREVRVHVFQPGMRTKSLAPPRPFGKKAF